MATFNQAVDALASAFGGSGGLSASASGVQSDSLDDIYKVNVTNWYKTLPYGFVFYDRNVNASDPATVAANSVIFYLPISPSNITVNTNFATNIVTTLYGVVEEHSDVRYFDITISGTTGFAPRFFKERNNTSNDSANSNQSNYINNVGRTSFQNNSVDLGGFLPEVTNVINQVANVADTIAGFAGNGEQNETGIRANQSGYAAFHNFYRFLLRYKKDMAGLGKAGGKKRKVAHPLQFLNYKDGVKYDCIPQTFTLVKSAENPMLYNYNIKMRCFNIRNVNDSPQEANQLDSLGLGDIVGQSTFSSLTGVANSAATLISGFI